MCHIDPQALDPGWSGYSPKGSIAIQLLSQVLSSPTITAPGSTVLGLSPVLSWNPVPNANTYRIQVGANSSFDGSADGTTCSNCIYNKTSSSPSYQAGGLAFGTTYYWRVRAEYTENTNPSPATGPGSSAAVSTPTSGWLPSAWVNSQFAVTSPPLAGIAPCDSKCAYQNHSYAQLSAAIYNTFQAIQTPQDSNPVTGPGSSAVTTPSSNAVLNGKVGFWKLDDELYVNDVSSGFVGGVFVNDLSHKVVVVYRGTEITSWNDLSTDYDQLNILPAQYAKALALAKKAQGKYDKDSKFWKESVVITGHSLGGGMAQYVAATMGLKAVGFNSAGLSENSILEAKKSPEYSVAGITHFVSANYGTGVRDVVSYYLTLLGKVNGVNILLPNLNLTTLNLHSMENLRQQLDNDTTSYLSGKVEPFFTTLESKYSGIMGGHSKSILFQDAYYRQYPNGALFGAYDDEFYYLLPNSVLKKFGTLDSAMGGL